MAKAEKIHKTPVVIPGDKLKAADFAVASLEKQYGKGAIMKLGSRVGIKHPCIPTGIYQLDRGVIQAGGFPRGRVTEIFGAESGGKTTLTLQVIAQAQKGGDLAAFIDAEHALDPTWASTLGVDVDNLYVSQPDNGEQALETAEELVRSGAFGIVVVDSVAALVPQAEIDGEMGQSFVGLQARLMSQALRKLTGAVSKSNTSLVFINQLREKIGIQYGNPEVTAGGRALKFYATLRLDVRRIATIKDGEIPVGNNTKIKAVKNKVGAPFRECETDLLFGVGFNTVGSVIDAGVLNGAISKSGSWYSFRNERLGQGRDASCAALRDDDKLFEKIYAAVVKADEEADAA